MLERKQKAISLLVTKLLTVVQEARMPKLMVPKTLVLISLLVTSLLGLLSVVTILLQKMLVETSPLVTNLLVVQEVQAVLNHLLP